MVIYIAGPMTGIKDHNFPEFQRVERMVNGMGHCAISPEHLTRSKGYENLPDRERYAVCMRQDIAVILLADEIWCLSGWASSKGAKLEVHIAQILGIPVRMADTQEPITTIVGTIAT